MTPEAEQDVPGEEQPPFKIEKARSGRAKCKTCRRAIQKEKLRIGVLIQGPFGPGYLWHHLSCAARKRPDDVEQAYAERCWPDGLEVPDLDGLRAQAEKQDKEKKAKKEPPFVEIAPTGRSKCKHCDGLIEKDSFRVVLLRNVEFYGQTRSGPINVHPGCVAREIQADDCATETEGFVERLREQSAPLDAAALDQVIAEIGSLDGGA